MIHMLVVNLLVKRIFFNKLEEKIKELFNDNDLAK